MNDNIIDSLEEEKLEEYWPSLIDDESIDCEIRDKDNNSEKDKIVEDKENRIHTDEEIYKSEKEVQKKEIKYIIDDQVKDF